MMQLQQQCARGGHAIHFLERLNSRASDSATELAMDLYHKPQALRYVVASAPIPKQEKRVAVSLDAGNRGPFLVVDRSTGRFVTCLGKGMNPRLNCIQYAQLVAHLRKHRKFKEDIESIIPILRDERQMTELFHRMLVAGCDVTKEEIHNLAIMQTVLRPKFIGAFLLNTYGYFKQNRKLLSYRKFHPIRHREVLKRHFDEQWLIAHLSVLISFDGTRDFEGFFDAEKKRTFITFISMAATNGMIGLIIRLVFAIGRFGKVLLPACKRAAISPIDPVHWLLGILGMGIIALRQKKCRAEVKKTHKQIVKAASNMNRTVAKLLNDAGMHEVLGSLVTAIEHPTTMDEQFVESARAAYFWSNQGQRSVSRRYRRLESIPESTARAFVCGTEFSVFHAPRILILLFQMLPWLARCEPHELYMPEDQIDGAFPKWEPQKTIQLLEAERESWGRSSDPIKAEKKQRRNAPCPCGSGKKYKRCCLEKRANPRGGVHQLYTC